MGDAIDEWLAKMMEEITPSIDTSKLSERDRARVGTLTAGMGLLTQFIDGLSHDIELFDHAARDKSVEMRWTPIACRDAALNLWSFHDALRQLATTLGRCPGIKTKEREKALQSANDLFVVAFPDAENMRDITAHPVGHLATKGRKDHRVAGVVLVHTCWQGRKVINSFEGREISFEISAATVETLRVIRKVVFDAFR